jgi:hypothetical protein
MNYVGIGNVDKNTYGFNYLGDLHEIKVLDFKLYLFHLLYLKYKTDCEFIFNN